MNKFPIYQIIGWNERFENSRSREIEFCSWVAMPNKHHGTGFTRIISSAHGMALYGLWGLIVQACSRQPNNLLIKRNGWLTDDGTATGYPWDANDLALRWRQPTELVQSGLDLFCSVQVAWMISHMELPIVDNNYSNESADDRQHGTNKKSRGIHRRERKGKEEDVTSSSPFRIQGVDTIRLKESLLRNDYLAIIGVFGGNMTKSRQSEWARDVDQMSTHELVAIFAWMREQRNPIREPSGMRKAREEWRAIPFEKRREVAITLLRTYGIDPPLAKSSDKNLDA
jgi:hypothetical protein